METEALRGIGLHDNEIRVYLALLEMDEAHAPELAQRAGISRTLVYHFLNRLMEKGMAAYVVKNNRKLFRAAEPQKLLDFMKEKEDGVRALIPQLLKLKKPRQERPYIEVYEGFAGLKAVLNDVLDTRPMEWLDITPAISHVFMPDFLDWWEKQREKKRIRGRVLVDKTPLGARRARRLRKFRLLQIKFMPKWTSPATIWIYANKVSITLWSKDYPMGILIENRQIASRFKGFFNSLWEMTG